MNRDEPANFKRIETQTMFRLPSATGASLTKPEPPMRAEIRSGCNIQTEYNVTCKAFGEIQSKN
jgi:hypothetical protein